MFIAVSSTPFIANSNVTIHSFLNDFLKKTVALLREFRHLALPYEHEFKRKSAKGELTR